MLCVCRVGAVLCTDETSDLESDVALRYVFLISHSYLFNKLYKYIYLPSISFTNSHASNHRRRDQSESIAHREDRHAVGSVH